MSECEIIEWLLRGDVSVQYQACRDLFGSDQRELQNRIAREGWGGVFFHSRKKAGTGDAVFISPNGCRRIILSWT